MLLENLTPAAFWGLRCDSEMWELDTAAMPTDVVHSYYDSEAPHTMYIGEVINCLARKIPVCRNG